MDDWQGAPSDSPAPSDSQPELGQDGAGGPGPAYPDEGDRGCEPPVATKEREADSGFTNTVEFTSGIVSAGHMVTAGQIFNQQQFHFSTGAGGAESIHLSRRHFTFRTSQELGLCKEELVFEPPEIGELRSFFEEERFLVLAGEPEGGKRSLGLLLGCHLTGTLQWQGMLACQGLGSSFQVDLEKLASDEELSQHVLMFEDALAGENSDLKSFLKTVDSLRLTTLKERLRKNSIAILLTATSSSLTDFEHRLESLDVLRTVAPPEPDLLVRALHHFAACLPQYGESEEAVESFLTAHAAELARELRTIPRVARFVQEYLAEVVEGNLSFRQALSRMDDLSHWLTADLARDLDAQAAVLALVLGSAVPPAEGMPWFSFDDLRRRITELLRKELRIPEDQPSSPAGLGRDFLDRARAYVATMPSPLPDLVRFQDERYPQRLWQALIGPARDLATLVIPLLKELALRSSPILRTSAASALGRLGQIGPADLAVPLLREWTCQPVAREDLPGLFLQGSAGSNDETYKDFCLATLRDLAFRNDAGVAEAAIRNLSLLGAPDPEVPVRELCGIAQERLTVQMDVLRKVEEEVAAKEEEIRRGANPRQVSSALQKLHEQSHDLLIAALVPENRIHLLGAVQYALAGVLFAQGGDPGPVLRKLSARMKSEPVKLAPVFAYLFLHRKGLVDLLDRYKWSSGALSADASRFLLASRPGERDPEALLELLERVFSTLEAFPGFFRFLLEQRFFEILKSWSREGCEITGLRPTVARLLSALLASKNANLRRRMERFLETDPDFGVRGSRLRALARDVLDGKVIEDAPALSPRPRRLPAWMGKRDGEET
jgi:hypothetical protein